MEISRPMMKEALFRAWYAELTNPSNSDAMWSNYFVHLAYCLGFLRGL